MIRFLTQLWRALRVSGFATGAIAAVSATGVGHDMKLVVAAVSTAAAETAYRQLVPVKEQGKLATLYAAVRAALRTVEVGEASVKVPA
jgi:hypothetical protein